MGMIGLSCYILADTYFVSQGLGTYGLTALNLAIPIYSFIHGSGLMIGMGGGTRYSIQRSQRDQQSANRTFTNAVYLAALFAVLFVSIGVFFSGTIVTLFGADEHVYAMSKTYLQVILLFAPAFLMNNVLLCFVRNDGAPQLSMAAMIGGSLSNVVLDWVFIFPCQMGIFGAAFATGLAPIISMMILSPHFIRKNNQFHFAKCMPEIRRFVRILSSGVPSLVTEVSSGIVIIVFNSILLNLAGNVGVAAWCDCKSIFGHYCHLYRDCARHSTNYQQQLRSQKYPKYQVDPKICHDNHADPFGFDLRDRIFGSFTNCRHL